MHQSKLSPPPTNNKLNQQYRVKATLNMMKEFKNICLLALTSVLVACGAASDSSSGKETAIIDDVRPLIQSITPDLINNTEIKISQKTLIFEFNEPIDPDSVTKLSNVKFITSSGKALEGTWVYSEKTEAGKTSYWLTLTFIPSSLSEGATSLPSDETFKFRFNNTITDLAGNGFIYEVNFNTPQTYDVSITATGLPLNTSLEIEVSDQALEAVQTAVSQNISSGEVLTVKSRFVTGTTFRLSIKKQPNDETFCAFSQASGTIVKQDAIRQINCSNVVPYNTLVEGGVIAVDWNAYYSQTDSDGKILDLPNIHSGEQRKFTMDNATNTTCENLIIKDTLDAFEWSCKVDTTDATKFVIYSTRLKTGKYLSDLLNFSRDNPSWLRNSVSVKELNGAELNNNKALAIWWNNPVAVPDNAFLTSTKTIYIIPDDNSSLSDRYIISGNQVGFVVKPGITLVTASDYIAGIYVAGAAGVWLEGSFNVKKSSAGIFVANGYQTQIHNLTVTNAIGDGIKITQSELTFMSNITTTKNGGNGMSISGQYKIFDDVYGTNVRNIVTSKNSGHGLFISKDSNYNKLSSVTSTDNKLDGINITQNTVLVNIETDSNLGNGLVINGQNNIVTMLTSSSNGLAGIKISNDNTIEPKKNILSHSTIVNNTGSALVFDDDLTSTVIESNFIVNILDAFNNTLVCGVSTTGCDNVTSVTSAEAVESDIFFRPGTGSNAKDWGLFNTDTIALNKNTTPTSFVNTHFFEGAINPVLFLENAYEISGDRSGNDNGLCETNETCIYTSNIGSYQGHGDDTQAVIETDSVWESSNVTLIEKVTNGYPPL